MTNTLFFDTETTGLKKDNFPDIHRAQPMPTQIGLKLDDVDFNERAAMNFMVKTNGEWTVSPKAAEVTGIDAAVADAYGIDLITGVEAFLDMVDHADRIVAHNIAFDVTVMRRATYVYCEKQGIEYKDPFAGKTLCCTMLNSMDLVKATPMRYGRWKWPRLEEAVKYFFDEELEGAHDAMVDVRACARVYYELINLGVVSGKDI